MEKYYSPQEVAEKIGITAQTVRGWILKGKLRAIKVGPGRSSSLRIPESDLKRFLMESFI